MTNKVEMDCLMCKGTGFIVGVVEDEYVCPCCKGTGKVYIQEEYLPVEKVKEVKEAE